mgnify:CR=1 FL=1
MVLEDLENDDQRSSAALLPVVMSLLLHIVLAIILWSMVFSVGTLTSIRLTASLSAPSSSVPLKIQETVRPVKPVLVDGDEPARSTDSTIEDLLLETFAENSLDVPKETNELEQTKDADKTMTNGWMEKVDSATTGSPTQPP